jgi:hypothetical protein
MRSCHRAICPAAGRRLRMRYGNQTSFTDPPEVTEPPFLLTCPTLASSIVAAAILAACTATLARCHTTRASLAAKTLRLASGCTQLVALITGALVVWRAHACKCKTIIKNGSDGCVLLEPFVYCCTQLVALITGALVVWRAHACKWRSIDTQVCAEKQQGQRCQCLHPDGHSLAATHPVPASQPIHSGSHPDAPHLWPWSQAHLLSGVHMPASGAV